MDFLANRTNLRRRARPKYRETQGWLLLWPRSPGRQSIWGAQAAEARRYGERQEGLRLFCLTCYHTSENETGVERNGPPASAGRPDLGTESHNATLPFVTVATCRIFRAKPSKPIATRHIVQSFRIADCRCPALSFSGTGSLSYEGPLLTFTMNRLNVRRRKRENRSRGQETVFANPELSKAVFSTSLLIRECRCKRPMMRQMELFVTPPYLTPEDPYAVTCQGLDVKHDAPIARDVEKIDYMGQPCSIRGSYIRLRV
ncbi:hypothetical protein VTK73DRAFT_8698 [Phialemonium thermophilum]|uniref:Uncharacterized protein n=1 Tax=Phialemonium thermophilum TaxID=223376 RepID=A0ABR3W6S9_9PEZI